LCCVLVVPHHCAQSDEMADEIGMDLAYCHGSEGETA
jgi:hypothetical protein